MPRHVALRFDPEREEAELRRYLGSAYDVSRLQRNQEEVDREAGAIGDEQAFYRNSEAYLYNLTGFAMTGTKLPYLKVLTTRVPPGSRVLDYGCGIGSDGLMLLEAGYDVEFADFDNPSTRYLRWRLEHRSLRAPIHDLDSEVPGGFDAAFAFDVAEHVRDPYTLLAQLERRAALIAVNLLEYEPHQQPLHYELPISDLLRHAAAHRLEYYRVLHGSSHLVLYGPEPAGRARRLWNRARQIAGARHLSA